MSTNSVYDLIVIGGGPAGIMAAGRAAERGLRVLLLEKNRMLGKKLSRTGGGRCNVTNAEFDVRILLKHYGDAEQFLYAPFSQFGVQDTFTFFETHHLPLIVEERKRAFPHTKRAEDVTKVMSRFLTQSGVQVCTGVMVQGFEMSDKEKIVGVYTDRGIYRARAYILATGGYSHADTGSTGEGISWLSRIGHTVHTPNPSLVPLKVSDTWVRKLSGITLQNVRITFMQGAQKLSKQGNVLCTHFGLSGPLILNTAHEVQVFLKNGVVSCVIDLFPNDDVGTLRTRVQQLLTTHAHKTVLNTLNEWFPKPLVEAICSTLPPEMMQSKSHSMTKEIRYTLVDRMKSMTCTVMGTMGFDRAIVSDGGIDLREIDTRTMQSKIHKNLYCVGDTLHINRPSGGYSLQLCWTTGWVAGSNVCL